MDNEPSPTAREPTTRRRRNTPRTTAPANLRPAIDLLVDLLIDPDTDERDRPGLGLAIRRLREHRPPTARS